MLIKMKILTAGATWHAAGLLPLFNMSYSVGQIHKHSVALYQGLEEETGKDVGFRKVGNIRLALNQDRMDEYHQYAGVAATIGVDVRFLTPKEVKELWPLCNSDGIVCAIVHPEDGYIQPADLTQALAKGARARSATIYRNTQVLDIEQASSGAWQVTTDKGVMTCEHIISATGNYARQTGKMVGLDIPVIPVEHQYIVTEPHPELQNRREAGEPEMGVLRESDGSWYLRDENGGFILGPYEHGAPACYVDGPDPRAEYELFQEDIELKLQWALEIVRSEPPAKPGEDKPEKVNVEIEYEIPITEDRVRAEVGEADGSFVLLKRETISGAIFNVGINPDSGNGPYVTLKDEQFPDGCRSSSLSRMLPDELASCDSSASSSFTSRFMFAVISSTSCSYCACRSGRSWPTTTCSSWLVSPGLVTE